LKKVISSEIKNQPYYVKHKGIKIKQYLILTVEDKNLHQDTRIYSEDSEEFKVYKDKNPEYFF